MSRFKILFLLMSISVMSSYAYNFDKTLPLPGKSIADSKLQSEVMMPIYYYTQRVTSPNCQDYKITNTEISKAKANNIWDEIWTVKACSTTARIPISFTQTAEGTDYAIDYMNVKINK